MAKFGEYGECLALYHGEIRARGENWRPMAKIGDRGENWRPWRVWLVIESNDDRMRCLKDV